MGVEAVKKNAPQRGARGGSGAPEGVGRAGRGSSYAFVRGRELPLGQRENLREIMDNRPLGACGKGVALSAPPFSRLSGDASDAVSMLRILMLKSILGWEGMLILFCEV